MMTDNFYQIDYSAEDQKIVKNLIKLQEQAGSIDTPLEMKFELEKVCKIAWKKLKKFVMIDKDTKQLRVSS